MTIRVLLADDQALLRGTFRMLVDSAPDMEVVAEAATGREAVELTRSHRADLVLMDIRMPDLDGLAATRLISEDEDLAGVRVLVLTTFENDEYVAEALRAGASGFLGKGINPDELLDAIRVVAAGDSLLSPTATKALIARFLAQPAPPAGPRHRSWPHSPRGSARWSPWSPTACPTTRSPSASSSPRSPPRPMRTAR